MMLLEPLQMPENITIDESSYTKEYGKFEIGPLEPGFATTIGNTLRRVLLSSIQGAAVRFVKIEGLHHEFTAIPGTDTDFIDLILKLKKIVFKMDTLEELKLVLEHSGKGPVTAGEIQDSEECKVINRDLVLMDMVEDEEVRMEIWVGSGRGFVDADSHNMEDMPHGVIPVDSIYSPVKKVNFKAGNQRVGEKN